MPFWLCNVVTLLFLCQVLLMVIRVLGILCIGVAHQSNKPTQLEITNAEALVTLVHLLRTSKKAPIQVCACTLTKNPIYRN